MVANSCRVALLIAVALAGADHGRATAQDAGVLQYKVVAGDTLESVARRLMEQPRRYPEIARFNGLRDQDVIQPGQILRIPAPFLKMQADEAVVTAVKGEVTLNGTPPAAGARAGTASALATGADGQVTLRLVDGSEIRLQPASAVNVTEIRRNPVSGARAVLLNLLRGRLETDVAAGKGDNSRFTINTPTAALGVRGTSFRAATEGGNASTEVLEGSVQAAVARAAVDVDRGFGTKAVAGRPPLPPVPLLPAPGLDPLGAMVDTPTPELAFAPVPGAARYRGIVAEDAKFERVVAEGIGTAPLLRAAALRDGQYFFRARAIDAQGLEGWNADGRFRVRANPRPPQVPAAAPGGRLLQPDLGRMEVAFRWEPVADAAAYVLEVASDARFSADVRQFKLTGTRHPVVLPASPRRVVYWRVRSLDAAGEPGPAGAVQSFEMGVSAG